MASMPRAAARPLRASAPTTGTRAASTAAQGAPRQFFPVQSSPSTPIRPTAKPPSREWYTARPSLTQTLAHLDAALTQSRAHLFRQGLLGSISQSVAHDAEFHAVLPHPRQRRWKPAKDMAAYLRTGAQLKSSQYKRLTAALAGLEGLVPYARVADSLSLDGALDASSSPPALVVDPVALATGRASPSSSSSGDSAGEAARGEPAHGLATQLEQLLARFQQPAAVSSTGVALERVSGQARRLGSRDEHERVLAVGRRKESGARVWIVPASSAATAASAEGADVEAAVVDDAVAPLGRVVVNTLPLPTYFSQLPHRDAVVRPLSLTSSLGAFNVFAIVKGGGQAAQAEAVAMGLARALAEWERGEVEAGRRDEGAVSWRDILKRGASTLSFSLEPPLAHLPPPRAQTDSPPLPRSVPRAQPSSSSGIRASSSARRRAASRRARCRPGSSAEAGERAAERWRRRRDRSEEVQLARSCLPLSHVSERASAARARRARRSSFRRRGRSRKTGVLLAFHARIARREGERGSTMSRRKNGRRGCERERGMNSEATRGIEEGAHANCEVRRRRPSVGSSRAAGDAKREGRETHSGQVRLGDDACSRVHRQLGLGDLLVDDCERGAGTSVVDRQQQLERDWTHPP